MDIMSLLIIWLAFCMGAWLQELQRIEDEEQAKALSRKK